MIFDNQKPYTLIVESRLCAILLQEHVSELVNVIGLSSANIRPDLKADKILKQSEMILNAFDNEKFDTESKAGKEAFKKFWNKNYPNQRRYKPLRAKDPSDMYAIGLDLKKWIKDGIIFSKAVMK